MEPNTMTKEEIRAALKVLMASTPTEIREVMREDLSEMETRILFKVIEDI